MLLWRKFLINFLKLLFFWILVFDFQRILFTIHNFSKFQGIGVWEYLGAYFHSFRLDLASASFLSLLPLLFLLLATIFSNKIFRKLFFIVLIIEAVFVAAIHCGEINAYTAWNHKLTSRVFTHLLNPDEVVRSADWGMTIGFFVYAFLEIVFSIKIAKWLFKNLTSISALSKIIKSAFGVLAFSLFSCILLLFSRGGLQPIPINIDAAYYSKNYVTNDLSVNSTYFFGKSYLLYNRSDIDNLMPKIDLHQAQESTAKLFDYPKEHDNLILKNTRPNVVFIILEGWSANAVSCLDGPENITPHFDNLAKEGILFTNFFSNSGTSEIGNASIFSGYPAIPEISLSMQSEKHRKLPTINEDLKKWGYSTNYLFSGDLKYGNIGGFFTDHGFDVVLDENDFPSNLKRGKLNYYDHDLFKMLLSKIDETKEPFLHCAFTGSTHSPYDFPNKGFTRFKGEESAYLNSMMYADKALFDFLEKCKTKSWYQNTLFVFVADHGHGTPENLDPSDSYYYRIPMLFWGPALKDEYKGIKNNKMLCQTDIPTTLMYQMKGDISRYPWSRDMFNPLVPEFVLHTIQRGYGYVTPRGNFTFLMDSQSFLQDSLNKKEVMDGKSFLLTIYNNYKNL